MLFERFLKNTSLFSYKFESLFILPLKESFLKLPYVVVFISTSALTNYHKHNGFKQHKCIL